MAADPRTTGYLDDCQRPDEKPLSYGGRWHHLYMSDPSHPLELHNHAIFIYGVSGGSGQAAFWYQPFSGDVECWSSGNGGHDLREGLRMYLHLQDITLEYPGQKYGQRSYSGYVLDSNAGIISQGTSIARWDNGDSATPQSLASVRDVMIDFEGGFCVFRSIGDKIQWWQSYRSTPTVFNLNLEVTDTTYRSGYIGLGTQQDDSNPGWSGFGGGRIHNTQIYRWVK